MTDVRLTGTSEGAQKGWETRKAGKAKDEAREKYAAAVRAAHAEVEAHPEKYFYQFKGKDKTKKGTKVYAQPPLKIAASQEHMMSSEQLRMRAATHREIHATRVLAGLDLATAVGTNQFGKATVLGKTRKGSTLIKFATKPKPKVKIVAAPKLPKAPKEDPHETLRKEHEATDKEIGKLRLEDRDGVEVERDQSKFTPEEHARLGELQTTWEKQHAALEAHAKKKAKVTAPVVAKPHAVTKSPFALSAQLRERAAVHRSIHATRLSLADPVIEEPEIPEEEEAPETEAEAKKKKPKVKADPEAEVIVPEEAEAVVDDPEEVIPAEKEEGDE